MVCLRGAFDQDWIEMMRLAAERGLSNPTRLGEELAEARRDPGRFFHDTFLWLQDKACRRFVFDSPAAQIAALLMGSGTSHIFFDQWLIKEPGTPTRTPWHQDLPYWPVDGSQVCTVWLALDPVTANRGAVEYVVGSHRWNARYKPETFSGNAVYSENLPPVPDIDAQREGLDIVRFELEPGDCTVHHALTVHGSPGNESERVRRRASISRWAGDDAVYYPREGIQEIPTDPGIPAGDPIRCELWPRVWPRSGSSST